MTQVRSKPHESARIQLLREVRSALAAHVDPVYKEGATRFFKEEVVVHGVRSADLKPIEQTIARAFKSWVPAERFAFCEDLWQSETLEEGAMVCHVLRRFGKTFGSEEFKLFERWLDSYVHNWAHCDGLSTWLIAACIGNVPPLKQQLMRWQKSPNRWKRRASAVSLLQEGKRGRSLAEISQTAAALANDKDDMVQKGIGWLLKETYPRNPEAVVALLEEIHFPRLVIRYAGEKMTRADKARFKRS